MLTTKSHCNMFATKYQWLVQRHNESYRYIPIQNMDIKIQVSLTCLQSVTESREQILGNSSTYQYRKNVHTACTRKHLICDFILQHPVALNHHCLQFLLPPIMQQFFDTIHALFTKMLVKIHMSLKYIYYILRLHWVILR
jgi:hypothetical protein